MSLEGVGSRVTELQLTKYNKYSRDIKRLLIASGIWPGLHPIVQSIVAFFALVTLSVTFVGAINFSLHYISNIMVFTQTIGLNISLMSTIMKICIFLMHRDDLASLNAYLSARFTRDLQYKSFQPFALFHYGPFANLFYTLTATVGVTSLLTSVLIPLLALRHGKYVPVIPSLFPFTYEPGSLVYWLIQVTNMWAAFFVWTVTCGVDSVFGLYTMQMCGELRVLAYRFENLRTSVDYQKDLKECITRHHLLMRSRDSLERVFGILAIWLAVTSAVIQCTLVFQVTELLKTMNPFKILYVIGFIALKLVQAFMYAWYGNLISEESKLCLDSIYNASWAGSGNQEFMNDVLLVLSQKPLVFRAKGCLNVKMEMFSKILNTSVSYFFLLRTLENESET